MGFHAKSVFASLAQRFRPGIFSNGAVHATCEIFESEGNRGGEDPPWEWSIPESLFFRETWKSLAIDQMEGVLRERIQITLF
jgi:hypothetical protein